MSLATEMWDDLIEVESDLGNPTITWDGQDYVCVPSMNEELLQMERGGFSVQKILNLTLRTNLFPDGIYPKSSDIISYQDQNFGVATSKVNANQAILELVCVSDTRGG